MRTLLRVYHTMCDDDARVSGSHADGAVFAEMNWDAMRRLWTKEQITRLRDMLNEMLEDWK